MCNDDNASLFGYLLSMLLIIAMATAVLVCGVVFRKTIPLFLLLDLACGIPFILMLGQIECCICTETERRRNEEETQPDVTCNNDLPESKSNGRTAQQTQDCKETTVLRPENKTQPEVAHDDNLPASKLDEGIIHEKGYYEEIDCIYSR